MAQKNLMGKSRPAGNPYAVFRNSIGWRVELLKSWQADSTKPYARWFCLVEGYGRDMGDTYVRDVVHGGQLVSVDDAVPGLREELERVMAAAPELVAF